MILQSANLDLFLCALNLLTLSLLWTVYIKKIDFSVILKLQMSFSNNIDVIRGSLSWPEPQNHVK